MKIEISQSEYREKLKILGFKVRFNTVSFQDLARASKVVPTIFDMEGNKMPTSVIQESEYPKWKPALEIYNQFKIKVQ